MISTANSIPYNEIGIEYSIKTAPANSARGSLAERNSAQVCFFRRSTFPAQPLTL